MRTALAAFLVDTSVLVYAYDQADDQKRERAIEVLARIGGAPAGALSVQIVGEFFTTVTRKIPVPLLPAEAERTLINLARSWTVYPLDRTTVLEAVRGSQDRLLSYWDALIWATAKLNDVPNVLSEDFNPGGQLEGVRFLNPFAETFDMSILAVTS